MNRPSYKELWLDERKDRDEQLQWIRDAVDGNAKFRNSEPPYSEEEELARQVMTMHTRIAELEAERRWIPVSSGEFPKSGSAVLVQILEGQGIDLVFFRSHKFCTFAGTTVTHWMPLPNPPEVK